MTMQDGPRTAGQPSAMFVVRDDQTSACIGEGIRATSKVLLCDLRDHEPDKDRSVLRHTLYRTHRAEDLYQFVLATPLIDGREDQPFFTPMESIAIPNPSYRRRPVSRVRHTYMVAS